jgi:uncharacterized protein YbjT (DUF2867 family)
MLRLTLDRGNDNALAAAAKLRSDPTLSNTRRSSKSGTCLLCHFRHSVSSYRTATSDGQPGSIRIEQLGTNDMPGKILAIGAEGRSAGLIVPALAALGADVRGLIRDPRSTDRIRKAGASETVVGDLNDADSIERALEDIRSVFYIAPAFLRHEAEIGQQVVAAAVKAGVRRFVFSSVIHPVLSDLVNHAAKAPVEEAVLNSGMEYSFLHPALFFQNFAPGWADIVKRGVVAEPWAIESRFSRVDYRDVAEVAAIALTEDRLLDGTFELCAPGAHDRNDVAQMIGEVLGHPITAEKIDPISFGGDAKPMLPMFAHYDRDGLRGNSITLRAILGREPRTLQSYFKELAHSEGQKS